MVRRAGPYKHPPLLPLHLLLFLLLLLLRLRTQRPLREWLLRLVWVGLPSPLAARLVPAARVPPSLPLRCPPHRAQGAAAQAWVQQCLAPVAITTRTMRVVSGLRWEQRRHPAPSLPLREVACRSAMGAPLQ